MFKGVATIEFGGDLTSRSRIFRTCILITVVLAALLVFPQRIPEFAGFGLAWCTYSSLRKNRIVIEFGIIPIWLLMKWPEPTITLVVFALTSLSAAVYSQTRSDRRFVVLLLVWSTWLVWLWHHHAGATGQQVTIKKPGPVVCLGDSLTDYGYPQQLEQLIDQPVADFGFNGYTTEDGLKLVTEIIALKPEAVVIELGGHDFRKGESRSATEGNLRSMIESFQQAGSRVILVEIPRGFVIDQWYGLERKLAREYGLSLIPDTMIRRLVFWSPIVPPGSLVSSEMLLSEDGLHPNENGNRLMAETIASYVNDN